MDWLDRFQQTFGQWYQSHFGVAEESELTPKDVLRSIIDAMEDARSEGLDGRVYVPNRYILELAVMNPEERAYLLSFLDEEELSTVLDRYMAHKNYLTRGPLDFTIEELDALDGEEKLYVRALFEKGGGTTAPSAAPQGREAAGAPAAAYERIREEPSYAETDPPTVEALAANLDDEPLTVQALPTAWAALLVSGVGGRRDVVSISKPVFCIGRSRHASNDLVLPGDGQVSKRHLRIELRPDGGATLYDLASTNGTYVNGNLVPVNVALRHGDRIEIGQTQIVFQRETEAAARPSASIPIATRREILDPTLAPRAPIVSEAPVVPPPATKRPLRFKRANSTEEHIVGSEVLIGRSMTCDIVINEPTISTQQARIQTDSEGRPFIVDLSGRATTLVNGRPLRTGERMLLSNGDRIGLGGVAFVFED